MKVLGILLATVALADERKVPPKTPEDRIEQLKRHITRLMDDHFSSCNKANVWENKMTKVCNRAYHAFTRLNKNDDVACGFFDADHPSGHGGPERKRRAAGDDDIRYSETDAIASIKGITGGMRNWSERYIAACGGQKNHDHIVNHSNKWRAKLTNKFNDGC